VGVLKIEQKYEVNLKISLVPIELINYITLFHPLFLPTAVTSVSKNRCKIKYYDKTFVHTSLLYSKSYSSLEYCRTLDTVTVSYGEMFIRQVSTYCTLYTPGAIF